MALPASDLYGEYNGLGFTDANNLEMTAQVQNFDFALGPDDGTFACELLLSMASTGDKAADDASWAALVNARLATLTTPYKKLVLKKGGAAGTTIESFDATPGSTFNAYGQQATMRALRDREEGGYAQYYEFRVTVKRPATYNAYVQRSAQSSFVSPLAVRRKISLDGLWTASGSSTALANFNANKEAYFTTQLALLANVSSGKWSKVDESATTDQLNLECVGRRTYQETVLGQFEAGLQVDTTFQGRRTAFLRVAYMTTVDGSAKANYDADRDTFATANLPTNVSGGEWELFDEMFETNPDVSQTVLRAVLVYWEAVAGLRSYSVGVQKDASQIAQVTIEGLYCPTTTPSATATANYTAGIVSLRSSVLALVPGTFDAKNTTDYTGYVGTTKQLYSFRSVIDEIAYPQSLGAADDPNVVRQRRLEVTLHDPGGPPRTLNPRLGAVIPLSEATAEYEADLDKGSAGLSLTDGSIMGLWLSKYKLHCLNAIKVALRAPTVILVDQLVGIGLTGATIRATVQCIVVQSPILYLEMEEVLTDVNTDELAPLASGEPDEYWVFKGPPEKRLAREARMIVVGPGNALPAIWRPGDVGSGYLFVDTGEEIMVALDKARKGEYSPSEPGWWPERGVQRARPTSWGVQVAGADAITLDALAFVQIEQWKFGSKFHRESALPSFTGT